MDQAPPKQPKCIAPYDGKSSTPSHRSPVTEPSVTPSLRLPDQIRLALVPRVLFPQTFMTLNVLEPRYERMVKECLTQQAGIGILYRWESSSTEMSQEELSTLRGQIGTYGLISDWYPQPDNTLSLNIDGLSRFEVAEVTQEADGLVIADVSWLEEEGDIPVSQKHQPLVDLLSEISHHPLAEGLECNFNLKDAVDVSLNLAHLMPISDSDKQKLLECHSADQRLDTLAELLKINVHAIKS